MAVWSASPPAASASNAMNTLAVSEEKLLDGFEVSAPDVAILNSARKPIALPELVCTLLTIVVNPVVGVKPAAVSFF